VAELLFEWATDKAKANVEKHGISFEEAKTAFKDLFGIVLDDVEHSLDEERFLLLGFSGRQRLLVVSYTMRDGAIRIISSRVAETREVKLYEKSQI
jgi:uncharacterized protein